MNFLSLLELFARALPALAQVTVAVLHLSGADKHKTVAGEIADGLNQAGAAASALHSALDSASPHGVQHGDPSSDPPT